MEEGRETITLYEEYRLIEKSEQEINGAWKGAHLVLFFMSFIFGSFCTFCFHILIYLFDENCILYPKIVSMKELRRSGKGSGSLIFDHLPDDGYEAMPVDFVTTQWVEKSACYLPAYVPLLSGICGVVWTTMFLMCSSGSRTLTGLQRPWRILPAVFVFSVAMGSLCTYASYKTHNGLEEFCTKLGELTGTKSCTYTINVASLAYERKIRGVYQATRLTILSAWLHTSCWIGAAVVALLRVILIVDFRLVRVRADLIGNIEQMLERHEKHIRTDEFWNKDADTSTRQDSRGSVHINFVNKAYGNNVEEELTVNQSEQIIHYVSHEPEYASDIALVPEETRKVATLSPPPNVAEEHRFIAYMLHDLLSYCLDTSDNLNFVMRNRTSSENLTTRQMGQQDITKEPSESFSEEYLPSSSSLKISHAKGNKTAARAALAFKKSIQEKLKQTDESTLTIQPSLNKIQDKPLKSSLRHRSIQTTDVLRKKDYKVQIHAPKIKHPKHALKGLEESKKIPTEKKVPDSNETNVPGKTMEIKQADSLSNITLTPSTPQISDSLLQDTNNAEVVYSNPFKQTESMIDMSSSFVQSLLPDAPASTKTTPKQTSQKARSEHTDDDTSSYSILGRDPPTNKSEKKKLDEGKLNQNEQPPRLDVKKPLQEKGQTEHSLKERQDYEEEEEASTSKGKPKKDSTKEKQD